MIGADGEPMELYGKIFSVMTLNSSQIILILLYRYTFCDMINTFKTAVLDKLAIEGKVIQRAECRPMVDDNYMKLKRYFKNLMSLYSVFFVPTYK